MTQIIALDTTTGAWDAVRVIKDDLADGLLENYAKASEDIRSPWVFLKASVDASIVELEAIINGCLGEYIRLGGLAAAE